MCEQLTIGHRYAEIKDLYVGQLAHVWVTDSSETTRANVEKKIDSYVEGDLQHATEMLSALWKIANKDESITAPSNPVSNVNPSFSIVFLVLFRGFLTLDNQPRQVKNPAHWAAVYTALIKSIRTGFFFDRKYWARHLKTGDVLKPVYFSSTIMDDKVHQLSKCTS